jgi:hypothetical protein
MFCYAQIIDTHFWADYSVPVHPMYKGKDVKLKRRDIFSARFHDEIRLFMW